MACLVGIAMQLLGTKRLSPLWISLLSLLTLPENVFAQHVHGSGLPHNIPNFCSSPTIQSAGSGAWSNPLTWSPGRVPGAGDRVVIRAGNTVTYDTVSDAALTCVALNGRLNFVTSNSTRLTVATLMVMADGHLWIGDLGNPISAGATAEIVIANTALQTQLDPEQYGNGVLAFGKVTIHGAVRTPSFVRVSAEPRAGQSALTVSTAPVGWRNGDKLVIPDTRHLKSNEVQQNYRPQWEERSVGSSSGTQITLNSPLSFDHLGARNGQGSLEMLPHVGNLSRNVLIRSANPSGTRGHVLFAHRADVDIRYAAFRDLGRTTVAPLNSTTFDSSGNPTHIGTNQIGRYPIHFHHVSGPVATPANGHQFTLIGNAIDGAPKWGVAIHNSHFGLVRGNVIYNADGAGLMTEDGNESFNVIEGNFAVRGTGQGGREAGGREGVGFYLRGPNNYVRDNVAANFLPSVNDVDAAYGFKIFAAYLGNIRVPNFPGADVSVDGQYSVRDANGIPLLDFSGNEVYGATESGLTYWWIGTFGTGYIKNAARTTIRNFRVWHVHNKAVYNYESSNVTIDGLVVRGKDPAASACCAVGITGADYQADGWIIRNADIQGMGIGILPSTANGRSVQIIEDSYFRNHLNIAVQTLWTSSYHAGDVVPRRVIVKNVRHDAYPGATNHRAIAMLYSADPVRHLVQRDEILVIDHDGIAGDTFQLYYAEQAPGAIVPKTILNPDGTARLRGSPVSGLTNAQTRQQYGIAIAGAVAPCTTVRPGLDGFVCPTSLTYTSPPPAGSAPPPPGDAPPPGSTTPDPGTPPADAPWSAGDADGDRKLDLTLFQPANGTWSTLTAASGYTAGTSAAWGVSGDIPVPGDYDGDRQRDLAVFRPSNGTWYIATSSSSFATAFSLQHGLSTDIPVAADYDGDGRTDVAVYRRSNGTWYFLMSSSNFAGMTSRAWGSTEDVPAPADFDGDRKADPAVFRPSNNTWYILRSASNYASITHTYGASTDVPLPADYDGDGKADLALYRPSAAGWFLKTSTSNFGTESFRGSGRSGDIPLRGDVDGDGRIDFVAYNVTSNEWFVLRQDSGVQPGDLIRKWGTAGEFPVPCDDTRRDASALCPVGPAPSSPSTPTPTTPTTPTPSDPDVEPPPGDAGTIGDADGDSRSDVTVFRPSNGTWYTATGSNYATGRVTPFGQAGDVPVPGDYDGDRKMDPAVFRPSDAKWYVLSSVSNFEATLVRQHGSGTDLPVAADFDGDGRTDMALFRPSNGRWMVRTSSSNYDSVTTSTFGRNGDLPAVADYDGDRKADIAVYRPSTFRWHIRKSAGGAEVSYRHGVSSTDIPVPADYDGDGKADLAYFREVVGGWFVLTSRSGFTRDRMYASGRRGEVPVLMDLDGDGTMDFVAYSTRNQRWYELTTSGGFRPGTLICTWGQTGDIAVPSPGRN
jgi:hypothetical protein